VSEESGAAVSSGAGTRIGGVSTGGA